MHNVKEYIFAIRNALGYIQRKFSKRPPYDSLHLDFSLITT